MKVQVVSNIVTRKGYFMSRPEDTSKKPEDFIKEELERYLLDTNYRRKRIKEHADKIKEMLTDINYIIDDDKLKEVEKLSEKLRNTVFVIQMNQMSVNSLVNRAKTYDLDIEEINKYIEETLGKSEQE